MFFMKFFILTKKGIERVILSFNQKTLFADNVACMIDSLISCSNIYTIYEISKQNVVKKVNHLFYCYNKCSEKQVFKY